MLLFKIAGIQKTTLLDYPTKVAAIVFTQGCNFRCGYCHNPELLDLNKDTDFLIKDFIDFLKTRQGKLDGVVISGGEPTLQSGLYDFIKEVKQLDFAVKLDTNGTNPKILEKLLDKQLIDYVAMDIKAPLERYSKIVGSNVNINNIKTSMDLIINGSVDYEFRTTVLKSQLEFEDFDKIGQLIDGAKLYYLQKFVPNKIYDKSLSLDKTYSDEEFQEICYNLKKYIKTVSYR